MNYSSSNQILLGNLGKPPCEGQVNSNLLFWVEGQTELSPGQLTQCLPYIRELNSFSLNKTLHTFPKSSGSGYSAFDY